MNGSSIADRNFVELVNVSNVHYNRNGWTETEGWERQVYLAHPL
jgi:hypothetical protein